ncbi:MAG: DUF1634 domain-containing protein [Spirochaetia bacterium]
MGIDDIRNRYITILKWGVGLGFIILFTGFVIYLSGFPEAAIPPEQVTGYWHLSAEKYREAVGFQTGWSWIRSLPRSDYLSYASLIYFALITPVCLAAVLPQFVRDRKYHYALITAGMLVILILAASGVISS